MKNSKKIIFATTMSFVMSANFAFAETVNNLVSKMQSSGYTDISVSKTFFGNDRVVGYFQGREHEVVLDRAGHVLRNHLENASSSASAQSLDDGGLTNGNPTATIDGQPTTGTGSYDDDDDDDHGGRDHDNDEDHNGLGHDNDDDDDDHNGSDHDDDDDDDHNGRDHDDDDDDDDDDRGGRDHDDDDHDDDD